MLLFYFTKESLFIFSCRLKLICLSLIKVFFSSIKLSDCLLQCFLRDHIARFLDDNFVVFDRYVKSMICSHAALLFRFVSFFSCVGIGIRMNTTVLQTYMFRLVLKGKMHFFLDWLVCFVCM